MQNTERMFYRSLGRWLGAKSTLQKLCLSPFLCRIRCGKLPNPSHRLWRSGARRHGPSASVPWLNTTIDQWYMANYPPDRNVCEGVFIVHETGERIPVNILTLSTTVLTNWCNASCLRCSRRTLILFPTKIKNLIEQQNGLILLNVHRDVKITRDEVINEQAKIPRKLDISFISLFIPICLNLTFNTSFCIIYYVYKLFFGI